MATTKKAAKKKAAKKQVSVQEEPKQIILTQEQYDDLTNIKSELSGLSWELSNIFSNDEKGVRELAFEIGALHHRLDAQQTKLDTIVTDIDPDPIDWDNYSFDEDEDEA